MAQLVDPTQIWEEALLNGDILRGMSYGIISHAYTHDRMGAQTRGDFGKAIFRIGVGTAVQSCLYRLLRSKGITLAHDTSDYKEKDYWDFHTPGGQSLDIKCNHVFSNFRTPGRGPLTTASIFNSDFRASWNTYVPMLVPKDQYDNAAKDIYIFSALFAPSSARYPYYLNREAKGLITVPTSQDIEQNNRYRRLRERAYAEERLRSGTTFEMDIISVRATKRNVDYELKVGYGDDSGNAQVQPIILRGGEPMTIAGITALHYVRLSNLSDLGLRRDASEELFLITFRGVDGVAEFEWIIDTASFEDVWIYDNRLYFVGWATTQQFREASLLYPRIYPNDTRTANSIDIISAHKGLLERGAFCYFYPPTIPITRGGTKNPNYYCLPRDMQTMDSLVDFLKASS